MTLTQDMWVALAILAVAIVLFVTEWLRIDIVALGVVIALMLTDTLTPGEALAGFSSSAVITIAGLFVVGGAVLQTGLAGMIGRRILRIAGRDEIRLTAVIMVAVALLSGVMSNTGTVAVLMPAVVGLAVTARISPSKLLIPLSFGSCLGGAMTLIGTPPNIIMSELLVEQNAILAAEGQTKVFTPFTFFDYTPLGALLLITGVVFMLAVGRRLLPDYGVKEDTSEESTSPDELMTLYHMAEHLVQLRVRSQSDLVGKTILESRLRRKYNLTVVEIIRPIEAVPVARFGEQQLMLQSSHSEHIFPTAETELRRDDVLIVQGTDEDIERAVQDHTLDKKPIEAQQTKALVDRQRGIAEVVLPPRSALIGKSLRDTNFARTYNLTVLSINRPDSQDAETAEIQNITLGLGDTLLVQGLWHDIMALGKRRNDFIVLGQPETMVDSLNTRHAPVAGLIMVGMLLILILDLVPLATAALIAALAMVLTGCLTMDEAYESIDWKSIVLIAGMLPMATALDKVGFISEVAEQFTIAFGDANPRITLAGLFLLTAVFTQVLSNTATAVLLGPIALGIALRLDINPYSFLMGVAVAASMAFASPVASPTNTLVLSAGKYSFMDYVKVGVPLILLSMIVTVIFLPFLFPF